MITMMGSVVVKDGMMEQALELVKEMTTQAREEESGNLEFTYYTSKGKGNEKKIYFYETYENDAAVKVHQSNMASFGPRMGPIFDMSQMTMAFCDPIM